MKMEHCSNIYIIFLIIQNEMELVLIFDTGQPEWGKHIGVHRFTNVMCR